LISEENKFYIQILHHKNKINISRYIMLDGIMVDENKVISLPLAPLDFTNKDKVVQRINTMILFS